MIHRSSIVSIQDCQNLNEPALNTDPVRMGIYPAQL